MFDKTSWPLLFGIPLKRFRVHSRAEFISSSVVKWKRLLQEKYIKKYERLQCITWHHFQQTPTTPNKFPKKMVFIKIVLGWTFYFVRRATTLVNGRKTCFTYSFPCANSIFALLHPRNCFKFDKNTDRLDLCVKEGEKSESPETIAFFCVRKCSS